MCCQHATHTGQVAEWAQASMQGTALEQHYLVLLMLLQWRQG